MSDRDAILSAIPSPSGRTLPNPWPEPEIDGDLVDRFATELAAAGGEVVEPSRLKELAGKLAFADADVPAEYLDGLERTDDVWAAEVGFTLADRGIADTGSLVLAAGPGRHRLASLAPPHHVAIMAKATLDATAGQAISAMPDRTTVVITGPSRTADIEGVIVRGIHGPRRLWVVITR